MHHAHSSHLQLPPTVSLGGLSPEEFLRDYWQKKPLLIRQAIPGFQGLLDPTALKALAGRATTQCRMVRESGQGAWRQFKGPFAAAKLHKLPASHWTLVVQELETHLPDAWPLLQRFAFIPYVRMDDLMVSYATPQGSVGPHYDEYDVFLLQGMGRRHWQISTQTDLNLISVDGLPLVDNFVPTEEWVLEPGDMLYLPPHVGHFGRALDDCMTYSIGFVAPTYESIIGNFLAYVDQTWPTWSKNQNAHRCDLNDYYADPDLTVQSDPAAISDAMLSKIQSTLDCLRWDRSDVATFLGRWLTGPKPHIVFDAPNPMLSERAFAARLQYQSEAPCRIALVGKSRMVFGDHEVYLNGDAYACNPTHGADTQSTAFLRTLANQRYVDVTETPSAALIFMLYGWYRDGFIQLCG